MYSLARLLKIKVYAFDPEPTERSLAEKMSELNGVQALVEHRDLFTVSDMKQFAGMRLLVLSDCEGFEGQLFNPSTLPLTPRWDLLTELHGRYIHTLPSLPWPHIKQIISLQSREHDRFEELDVLGGGPDLLQEYREQQAWLWCEMV